eukprot:scaffold12829_cov116-Isochrysis_galbana.AAC.7
MASLVPPWNACASLSHRETSCACIQSINGTSAGAPPGPTRAPTRSTPPSPAPCESSTSPRVWACLS